MADDKRLNEVIRVQKRPNGFVMMDREFIDNPELSWKAKGILAYLLSKPDSWKVIVGDVVKHASDGKASVYSGLAELSQHGYYEKKAVRNEKGIFIRWESTVYELPKAVNPGNTASYPLPENPEMDNQKMGKPEMENRTLVINDFNNNYITNTDVRVRASPPAPTANVYGEFNQVRMTTAQYDALAASYGQDKTTDYINRLDRHIASKGQEYKGCGGHYATIIKWINDDERKQTEPGRTKKNRFANYKGREWDYEKLEKLAAEYVENSCK